MIEIERMVVVIKPKEKFLSWLNSVFVKDPVDLKALEEDNTTLLIPVLESEAEVHEYFEEIYKDVFDNELDSWNTDETTWPRNRTFQLFQEFFEIELHSIVYDTVVGEHEDFEVVTLQ